MKCLVGYITKTGTTEEIALKIGKILSDRGIDVSVAAIGTITDLSGYDRLVLGSPVNAMKVLPEFKAFLSSKVAGSGIPVDLFIISYLFEQGRKGWRKAIQKEKERVRAIVNPSSIEIFAGKLPGQLPAFARLIFGTPGDLPLDLRDWGKIEGWAKRLAETMSA
ncbi:MAG: flavodoxin domain-containing protein [Spirochaetales bacterium]|jgi:menaquinone-dependent protoporphyrinogen oxidase